MQAESLESAPIIPEKVAVGGSAKRRRDRLLAINSLSTAQLVRRPYPVPGADQRLYALDYRAYEWDPKAWEKLGANQVYFQDLYSNAQDMAWLKAQTGSDHPVVRSDDLIYRGTTEDDPGTKFVEGFYTDFLRTGSTQIAAYKRFGVDVAAVVAARSQEGGSVVTSGVTNHNRLLARYPTTYARNGYLWASGDVTGNTKDENVLRAIGGKRGE